MAAEKQQSGGQEGWQPIGKGAGAWEKEGDNIFIKVTRQELTIRTEMADPIPLTQGWVVNKPRLVTIDTGAYVTVARPDIAVG
jgi:hypothetical protein